MTDNPIGVWKSPNSWRWYWQHPDCDLDGTWRGLSWGSEVTAGDAADAGREHMRRFHYGTQSDRGRLR